MILEKSWLVIKSHSQVIKFQCFGFVAFQLRKEFLHIQGECDFFLCSGCHYSTISLHTNQLLCVCVCCVFTCSSSLSSSSLLFLWRKTALDSSLSFCSNTSSSAGSCRASSSLSSSSSSSTELLLLLHTFIIDYTPVITQSRS